MATLKACAPQEEPGVERVVQFVAEITESPPAALQGGHVQQAVTDGLLEWLLAKTMAVDRGVRYRACQLLQNIVTALPESYDPTEVPAPPPPRALSAALPGMCEVLKIAMTTQARELLPGHVGKCRLCGQCPYVGAARHPSKRVIGVAGGFINATVDCGEEMMGTVLAGYYRVTRNTGLLHFFARLTRSFFKFSGLSRCPKPVISAIRVALFVWPKAIFAGTTVKKGL